MKERNNVKISDAVAVHTENVYLLHSHREKVQHILVNSELEQADIIDALISLHIVLEVGINTFFRQILPITKYYNVFPLVKTTENLDNISFGDKVALFLYVGEFDFSDKRERAVEYHKIINEIKKFSGIRNQLLHGHSISVLLMDGKNTHSNLSKNINLGKLGEQVKSFSFILEGLAFFFSCSTQGGITDYGKKQYIKSYLDTTFLPQLNLTNE